MATDSAVTQRAFLTGARLKLSRLPSAAGGFAL